MGRDRKNSHNGWHPEDEDRYVENRYIHEDEYDDEYNEHHARPQRASRRPRPAAPRRAHYVEDDYDDDYRRATPPSRVMRKVKSERKRRVWPVLLAGCGIGFVLTLGGLALAVAFGVNAVQNNGHISLPGLPTNHPFSQTTTQTIALTQISNVLICDKIGNVTMKVDPTATKTTVTAVKTVQATNASNAQALLKKVTVETQPPSTITQASSCATSSAATTPTPNTTPTATQTSAANTLTINVTLPQPTNNQVDLTITVPPIAVQSDQNPPSIDIEAARGNIDVEGISGKLLLQGNTGNITVAKAVLSNGSQLQTSSGNITFSGFLLIPTSTDTASDVSYMLSSETGNINVTLPANTNVMLNAYTNIGTIKSDFPIKTSDQGGSITYTGPLNSTAETSTSATLVLHLSTGNVHIQKSN